MGRWVVRKYISGNVIERSKVFIPGRPGHGRRRRVKGSTTAARHDLNARAAEKRLARLINCNFSHRDLLLTVKYDDAHLPDTWQVQEKDADNLRRRLVRAMKKAGAEDVKSILLTSELDGKTGEVVRKHMHIVISGTAWRWENGCWWIGERKVDEIWGRGTVWAENLWDQQDYTPLAVYLIRQVRDHTEGRQMYRPSRNLAKPIIEEEEVKTGRELRAPKGAVVKEKLFNDFGANYIRYIRPESKRQEKDRPAENDLRGRGVQRNE